VIERFDHLVIAVHDLDAAIRRYRDGLGFDVRAGGRHTGRGTHNAIVRFGLDYLEIIAVYDQTEAEGAGRGALATFLSRHVGGLVSYALATTDIEADATRLESAGLEAVGPFPMKRLRPDGSSLSWRLLVPGGESYRRPWPFLIQWDQPDGERLARETPGDHPNGVRAVREVAVVVAELERAVDLYGRQLGLRLAGRDAAPELAAQRAVFAVGAFRAVLLAPSGPGPVRDALSASGEGPYYGVLEVDDLERARRRLAEGGASFSPAPGVPDGLLIDPESVLGARLVLRPVGAPSA
jgi:catechol 2,3-dioxygenase-like lactoylglutathione lyase family enzyme